MKSLLPFTNLVAKESYLNLVQLIKHFFLILINNLLNVFTSRASFKNEKFLLIDKHMIEIVGWISEQL